MKTLLNNTFPYFVIISFGMFCLYQCVLGTRELYREQEFIRTCTSVLTMDDKECKNFMREHAEFIKN